SAVPPLVPPARELSVLPTLAPTATPQVDAANARSSPTTEELFGDAVADASE
ncbi:unnamed protein product, partial [Ilex paraguariensis]